MKKLLYILLFLQIIGGVFSFFLLCNIPQADLVPQIITENKKYVPKNKYSTKDFSH